MVVRIDGNCQCVYVWLSMALDGSVGFLYDVIKIGKREAVLV
jgi:hypothetical protein